MKSLLFLILAVLVCVQFANMCTGEEEEEEEKRQHAVRPRSLQQEEEEEEAVASPACAIRRFQTLKITNTSDPNIATLTLLRCFCASKGNSKREVKFWAFIGRILFFFSVGRRGEFLTPHEAFSGEGGGGGRGGGGGCWVLGAAFAPP